MTKVQLVLPVYNEQQILPESVSKLRNWCLDHPEYDWQITIANNASTDATLTVAQELSRTYQDLVTVHDIGVKGRGIALKTVWLTSKADIVAYMDIDLSTDINHITELIEPIVNGRSEITYGSRLHKDAETKRSFKREFISRSYVFVLRLLAGLKVTDAQCGFKAMSTSAARRLLPEVIDTQWFFDSELLIIAQHNGIAMKEIPVRWDEDTDTRVKIIQTALEDLSGIWRLRRKGIPVVAPRNQGPL